MDSSNEGSVAFRIEYESRPRAAPRSDPYDSVFDKLNQFRRSGIGDGYSEGGGYGRIEAVGSRDGHCVVSESGIG